MMRSLLIVLLLFITQMVSAHPSAEFEAQRLTLAAWADALATRDGDALAELTVNGDGRGSLFNDATQVIVRYAEFTRSGDNVLASPVVAFVDDGSFRLTVDVELTETEAGWRIASAGPSAAAVPEPLQSRNLPEHVELNAVRVALSDRDTGAPAFARVRITDAQGQYWPPDGHQKNIRTGWREDVGGDVTIAGETWAYVDPEFVVRVPPGRYTLQARKGTEYLPATTEFEVTNEVPQVTLALERWSHLNQAGWYAGDTHTHFLAAQTALDELRAEDLSVIYILATKWGELITDVERFTGAPSPVSTAHEVVVYNEETRHGWLGHTILHGIDELVYPLTWGGPSEGVDGGFDYPTMAHQADKAHALGGLVTWAHFPFPGGELAVDIGLGKIDTVDLFTWGDAFEAPPVPGLLSAVDSWYLFLNTGSRLPATAGTDKMLNVQVSGSVRTWAQVGDEFSYDGWLKALAEGRTFVSTGPVVTLSANGREIGDTLELAAGESVGLRATLKAPWDQYPVERLEIVAGGEVIAAVTNEDQADELTLSIDYTPKTSSWVAARAHGSSLLPYQAWTLLNQIGVPPMAHTSPIYLDVDGQPVWNAEAAAALAAQVQFAIQWARNDARYLNEAQRAEVISIYEQALRHYQR